MTAPVLVFDGAETTWLDVADGRATAIDPAWLAEPFRAEIVAPQSVARSRAGGTWADSGAAMHGPEAGGRPGVRNSAPTGAVSLASFAREVVSNADEERSVRQIGWACYVAMALPLVLAVLVGLHLLVAR